MSNTGASPNRSGLAFRVSILGPQQVEAYSDVHVVIDPDHAAVHVFAADGATHYLTIPSGAALIEWKDPAALNPQMRLPAFGPGTFEQVGEQVQRMMEGMRHGLDPE